MRQTDFREQVIECVSELTKELRLIREILDSDNKEDTAAVSRNVVEEKKEIAKESSKKTTTAAPKTTKK